MRRLGRLSNGAALAAAFHPMTPSVWPRTLWIVRHGESAGNVARGRANAAGDAEIKLMARDIDVPLSTLGERQARALGRWFAEMPEGNRPTAILTSPYGRARKTAQIVAERAGLLGAPLIVDERLREKELGILDRLTTRGVTERFPEQAELRTLLGKFYHRPPGGENWCDVVLRLRGVVDTLSRELPGERVLIVGHQVVVNCMRYVLERMTEEQILAIDRQGDIFNCSVTSYDLGTDADARPRLLLKLFNYVTPIAEAGETITSEPDAPRAPS